MFCLHCGTENSIDSKYCKECGATVSEKKKRAAVGASPKLSPHIAEELGASDPANPQLQRLLEMAFWHNQAGNIPAAMLACEAALIVDPESTTALSLLGCLYEKQGDAQKAINVFERVVELNPDSDADHEKLASLKRGEYLKPLLQPIKYRWLPPAMVGMVKNSKTVRGVAALTTALVVFAIGAALLRPHPSDQSAPGGDGPGLVGRVPAPANFAGQTATAANRAADNTPPAYSAPNYTQYATGSDYPANPAPSYSPYQQQATAPVYTQATPAYPVAEWPSRDQRAARQTSVPSIGAVSDAPSVDSVKPIIPSQADLSGAVQVAPGWRMPVHTVMVGSAAGDGGVSPVSDQSANGTSPGSDQPQSSGPPPPTATISIRVHGSDSALAQNVPADSSDGVVNGAATDAVSRGASLQSKALGLQQEGQYRSAQHIYNEAISAYKQQIATGLSVDEAQRGIEACQTGVQICQSSE